MSLSGKLQKWVDAGLINADQKSRILEHENIHSSQRWKHGVIFAGLFSILLGISLMIAANWQDIAWQTKLGLHFIVNIALAALVWRWHDNPAKQNHAQIALFALWGLTLTLIALMGQVFQLGGEAYMALRVWFWLTTPMILLFANTNFTARIWAIAFVFYVPYDLIAATWDNTENWNTRRAVLTVTLAFLPIASWLLGSWRRFDARRPVMAETLRHTAIFMALAAASFASIQFYDHNFRPYMLTIPAIVAVAAIALRFALQRRTWTNEQRIDIDLLCLAALFAATPYLAQTHSVFLGMTSFIAFWLLAGALWQERGHGRLVSFAITIVTLRLFIGFVELFGSMMMSGLGFILTGIVLIGLVQVARRFDRRLKGVHDA